MKLDDIYIIPEGFSIEKVANPYGLPGGCLYTPKHNDDYIGFTGISSFAFQWLRGSAIEACWHHYLEKVK